MEIKISKDMPFTQWYSHPELSDELEPWRSATPSEPWRSTYLEVDVSLEYMERSVTEHGPFEAVVCFSQSGTLLAIYIEHMRRQGREVPWHLNVLFCGSMIDDPKYFP